MLQTLQSAITQVPMVEQFFLNPLGLLGLLALLPLAVFYLVKPKPEEQVMPSMRFFHQEEGASQLRSALRTLLRNLVLLLQVLAVIGFAAALAKPFVDTFEQPENSVVILDRSASMQGDLEEAKNFVESRLGEKNTLIVVDSEVEVKAERAPPSRIKEIIERIKPVDTETDIASAVDSARSYRGRLVLASDLDQTVDERGISQLLTSLSTRPIDTLEADEENKWGVTGLEVGENSTEVDVTGFTSGNASLEVEKGGEKRSVILSKGETVSIDFDNDEGKNTVKLPGDGMNVDNTAYYMVPDAQELEISYMGPENRYFRKAVELAAGMEYSGNSTAGNDVYVLGGEVEGEKLEKISSEVDNGAAAVVFQGSRAMKKAFGFKTAYSTENSSVMLDYPRKIDVGRTEILYRNISSGESLSRPSHAVKLHSYGEGKILVYNIDDPDFRYSFLYPIFWKSALERISDTPTRDELNLEMGETVSSDSMESPSGRRYEGEVEMNETGFYTSGDRIYAVNLLSEDESSPDGETYSSPNQRNLQKTEKEVQSATILVLLALILLELAYLWYRGDL
jgi:hypothetical protein